SSCAKRIGTLWSIRSFASGSRGRRSDSIAAAVPARRFGGMPLAPRRLVRSSRFSLISTFAIWMTLAPLAATAQTNNRFAIGAELTVRTSDHASQEDAARGQFGPGLLWRFGNGRPGWGFHWGLNWYAVDIDRPIDGLMTELGELRLRPLMAGYGY